MIGYGYHPVTTATYLQRALQRRAETTYVGTPWAAQPGFAPTGYLSEIVSALPARPDLYLHVDSGAAWYFPRGLHQLECATACYLIDVHVKAAASLERSLFFDYAFSAQRDFVAALRRAGHPRAYWLPLACDPAIHRRHDLPRRYDIGFVGATGRGYERRRRLLERLARRYAVNEYRRAYTPEEMARVYSESRLVFNCSLRQEVNMRVFEGPATGSLLLTDRIDNGLSDLVVDGQHVVLYDDDLLLDLAEQYLRDEAARERVAEQGRAHMYAHHTYDHRADLILQTVFGGDGQARLEAPLRRVPEAEAQLAYARVYARAGRLDDTLQQLHSVPAVWRYRLPAARQFTWCLLRRLRHG